MNIIDYILSIIRSNKKTTQLYVEDLEKTYKSPDRLEMGLYNNLKPLANKKLIIDINDVKYERTTGQDGLTGININLPPGKYDANIRFTGDEDYKPTASYADIYVNPVIETSDLTMSEKDGSRFRAVLKDAQGNPAPNTKLKFTVNGVSYDRVTDGNGEASLAINLPKGEYAILTSSVHTTNSNVITIAEAPAPSPTPTPTPVGSHFGYWVFGRDMYNVDLAALQSQGVTDIFLNYYAFVTYGDAHVNDWIDKAASYNIRVHIWMQCFYDGDWHDPVNWGGLPEKISEAKKYANFHGVYGVHLDYLRYPGNAYKTSGGTEAINQFVKDIRDAIGDTFLSCAVMPESSTEYYYGQDIRTLGGICDAVLPMQYKGNYGSGRSWLASTTQMFAGQANTVWSGLQSYRSDDDPSLLPADELLEDCKTCLENGAKGAIMFRYGLSSAVDFNSLSSEKKETRMEGTNVNMNYKDGTWYQCAVYDDNGRVFGEVDITINGVTYRKTPDGEGLYKLGLNLPVGSYTVTSRFVGDDRHYPSEVVNSVVINEPPAPEPEPQGCSNPYESSPHPTESGCNGMGQNNSVYCGPSSIHKAIYKFGIRDITQGQIAEWAGTSSEGTDHDGINTAVAKIAQVTGVDLSVDWYNLSELGWETIGKIICQPNKAVFCHILYQNGGTCDGSGYYGHYELLTKVNTETEYVKVINSLGDYCGSCYCGYYQDRSIACQEQFINGISQKSICVITKN